MGAQRVRVEPFVQLAKLAPDCRWLELASSARVRYPIRVSSYRLWDTFYVKTEVALDRVGGWRIARAEEKHAGWNRSKRDCGG
jgi:hypothetical protein